MPDFCIIPVSALEDRRLTSRDLRTLLAVGAYTNTNTNVMWASQSTLARRAGISRTQLNGCVRHLVELGYLRKTDQFDAKTGAQKPALLEILYPDRDTPVPESGTPPSAVATPVPKSGTGGRVPKSRTPGVPKSGTQTTQLNVLTAASAREKPPAVRLTAAANAALDAKLGTNRNPILSSTAANLVEAVTQRGIPLEWAETAIFAAASAMERAPRTMQYFTPGLCEAWEREEARRAAGEVGDLGARSARRTTGATRVGSQLLTPSAIWELCVRVGLTARGQSRQAVEERVQRLHHDGAIADPGAFTALVMHVQPWAVNDIGFARDRDQRLAERVASWRAPQLAEAAR